MSGREVILASGSASRRTMLTEAGVQFRSIVPDMDEDTITSGMIAKGADGYAIANALAEAKAIAISSQHREALVVGGDQVLVSEGRLFNKATDRDSAAGTLLALRGKDHQLISAAVLAIGGRAIWRHTEMAMLHMREFSDTFLRLYLDAEMPGILGSVGCYRIEGRGAQLFDRVVGNQYCIRGMPLNAVVEVLRKYGGLKK